MTPHRCGYCGAPGQLSKCEYCHTLLHVAPLAPEPPTQVWSLLPDTGVEGAILRAVIRRSGPTTTVTLAPREMEWLIREVGMKAVYQVECGWTGMRLVTPVRPWHVHVRQDFAMESGRMLLQ